MLFAIIGTIDRGNFVFDRWPRTKQFPKIKNSISAGQLSQKLTQYFYYFGIFSKNTVFQTTQSAFSQSCLIQIFNANQKRLQVVLGIDDQCVMVSRSMFIVNNERLFTRNSNGAINTNLYTFQDVDQQRKDIVNSITLVWRAQNFEEVDQVKNKLSFMVGVLNRMQQSQNYLSKEIIKITQARDSFEKKLKQKCQELNKDPSIICQQFKIKQMFQQFYDLAQEYLLDIQIFKEISKFYNCCINNQEYNVTIEKWYGSIGSYFKIPLISKKNYKKVHEINNKSYQCLTEDQYQQNVKSTLYQIDTLSKTTLATYKKLQFLPNSLKDQRINKLYEHALKINDASLRQILQKQKSLNQKTCLQTIQFLKQNNAGLSVYPFNLKKYYNLYALKKMPSWMLIRKFNTKIFPQQNILKQIHSFSKYKRINMLDEKLKYIILQCLIKQVNVYIYYLEYIKSPQIKQHEIQHFNIYEQQQQQKEDRSQFNFNSSSKLSQNIQQNGSSSMMDQQQYKINILCKYINKPYNLNEILQRESQFKNISEILKIVIEKMNKKKSLEKQRENQQQMNRKKLMKLNLKLELNSPKHIKKSSLIEKQEQKQIDPLTLPKWGFYYIQKD